MSSTMRIRIILTSVVTVVCLTLAIETRAEVNDRAVVRDMRGRPVLAQSSGTCVRTKWEESSDECRPDIVQTTVTTQHREISEEERTVYFPFNVARLTPDAMQKLDTLSSDIKSEDDVKGARVIGYADRIGTPSYNEALSKKRAEAARSYLAAKGIVNASVGETRWFGATVPTTNCPADLSRPALIECLQKDRRVEVEIDYLPEVVTARE